MYDTKKICVLIFGVWILYLSLTSDKILQSVQLNLGDASLIVFFILSICMYFRLLTVLEKQKFQNKISLQQKLMKTIIDNSPLSMYLKDINGNILITNKEHSKLLGIKIDNIVGKNTKNLYLSKIDVKNSEDFEVIQSKKVINTERQITMPNGETSWVRLIKAPILDEKGNVSNILVIMRQIDDVKLMEERKDTFVATMTHDLKTPTIAQIRALELLSKNTFGELNNQQQEIVNQIINSCKYMYDLIFSILDTYLYDNGQAKINYEKFDMVELVSLIINEISYLLKEREQNILISNNCEIKEVVADRFQIKRVIINLLSNAITYGNRQSDILLNLENCGPNLIFSVKNKGAYIPDDKIAEMFLKYKSKENAKFRKTGTGLGLYLAKQIIQAHKGQISAKSTKDGVCNVSFSLPVEKPNNEYTIV